jgi:hypothetical protein
MEDRDIVRDGRLSAFREAKEVSQCEVTLDESIIFLKYGVHNRSSFIVYANVAFSVTKNWFFWDFLNYIWPFYTMPSHYVLSHSILDSEVARVQLEEMAYMKDQK